MKYIFVRDILGRKKKIDLIFKSTGKFRKSVVINGKRLSINTILNQRQEYKRQLSLYYRVKRRGLELGQKVAINRPVLSFTKTGLVRASKNVKSQLKALGIPVKRGQLRETILAFNQIQKEASTTETQLKNLAQQGDPSGAIPTLENYSDYFAKFEQSPAFRRQAIADRIAGRNIRN